MFKTCKLIFSCGQTKTALSGFVSVNRFFLFCFQTNLSFMEDIRPYMAAWQQKGEISKWLIWYKCNFNGRFPCRFLVLIKKKLLRPLTRRWWKILSASHWRAKSLICITQKTDTLHKSLSYSGGGDWDGRGLLSCGGHHVGLWLKRCEAEGWEIPCCED